MSANLSGASMPAWSLVLVATVLSSSPGPSAGVSPPAPGGSPHIVFLVSNEADANSYEAARTIPSFAERISRQHGFQTTVIKAEGPIAASRLPGIEAVSKAELLVVFCRRLGLQPEQLTTIKNHVNAGRPVVGIRTANHAFSVRGEIPSGYVAWWEFVADVLGAENRGYGPEKAGTRVAVVREAASHPILRDFPAAWHSKGNVYFTAPLIDPQATVLLTGTADDRTEPIAWTRLAGRSRVFYTSLGHPADFEVPHFQTLLLNGIRWALGQD
jgi:type 1 glutamine amidotransferase